MWPCMDRIPCFFKCLTPILMMVSATVLYRHPAPVIKFGIILKRCRNFLLNISKRILFYQINNEVLEVYYIYIIWLVLKYIIQIFLHAVIFHSRGLESPFALQSSNFRAVNSLFATQVWAIFVGNANMFFYLE